MISLQKAIKISQEFSELFIENSTETDVGLILHESSYATIITEIIDRYKLAEVSNEY